MRDRDTKRGGGGGGGGGGRRGRSGKPRGGKPSGGKPSSKRGLGLFDRKTRCPLLARVFVRVGAVDPEKRTKMTAAGNGFAGLVHRLFDEGAFFKQGANIEADEVQMHTWMDATLQEILTAVLKVFFPSPFLSFSAVSIRRASRTLTNPFDCVRPSPLLTTQTSSGETRAGRP